MHCDVATFMTSNCEQTLAKTSGYESLDTAALKAVRGSAYTAPDILSPEPSRLVITCGFQNRLAQCLY